MSMTKERIEFLLLLLLAAIHWRMLFSSAGVRACMCVYVRACVNVRTHSNETTALLGTSSTPSPPTPAITECTTEGTTECLCSSSPFSTSCKLTVPSADPTASTGRLVRSKQGEAEGRVTTPGTTR